MKTFKVLSVILALALSQAMTSCLNSDKNGYTVSVPFSDLFNAVVTDGGEVILYPKQSVKIDWIYGEDSKADLQIIGLQLPDMGNFPVMQFNSVPWKINSKGWMEINLIDAKPDATAGYASDILFNRLTLQTVNRAYNNLTFPPCLNLSYTIDNKYRVFALPVELIEVGETVVTNPKAGTTFTQSADSRSIYYIEMDPSTRKSFLVIQNAQFAENMPGMNMKFPGIPFEVNSAGHITFAADEITPALMTASGDINQSGTPAPNYPITNYRASYVADYGVNISFTCTPTNKEGVPMGQFDVKFVCQYPTSSTAATVH